MTQCSSVMVQTNVWREPLTSMFRATDLSQFQKETIGSASVLTTTYHATRRQLAQHSLLSEPHRLTMLNNFNLKIQVSCNEILCHLANTSHCMKNHSAFIFRTKQTAEWTAVLWNISSTTVNDSNLTNETNLDIMSTTVVGNMQAYNKPMKMSYDEWPQ